MFNMMNHPSRSARVQLLALSFIASSTASVLGQISGSPSLAPTAPAITLPFPPWATKIEDRNAAIEYWAAFASISKEASDAIKEIDWEALGTETNIYKLPPEVVKAAQALEATRWKVQAAIDGSCMKRCDFQPRWEASLSAAVPHLGLLRDLARAMQLEARWSLARGNPDRSVEIAVAMFRMSSHATSDRTLYGPLSAMSISARARGEVDAMIASGKLTEPSRQSLISALIDVRTGDPFHGREAVQGDRETSYAYSVAAAKSRPQMFRNGMVMMADESAQRLAAMSDDELQADVAKMDACYERILAVWRQPHADELFTELQGQVKQGEFGTFAQFAALAAIKLHSSCQVETGKLDELIARLKLEK